MIRVTDEYVIDVDENNYTVKIDRHTVKVDKQGKEYNAYTIVGYYNNLLGAIQGVKDDMVRKSLMKETKSLESALNDVKRISDEFISTFNKVAGGESNG